MAPSPSRGFGLCSPSSRHDALWRRTSLSVVERIQPFSLGLTDAAGCLVTPLESDVLTRGPIFQIVYRMLRGVTSTMVTLKRNIAMELHRDANNVGPIWACLLR